MPILNIFYRHGLWLAPLLFIAAASLLVFLIIGLIRLGGKSRLATLPLQERQVVQFAEAGRVVLALEGPRLSPRFSELSFTLLTGDGAEVAGHPAWFHARRSSLATVRMELRSFAIPETGQYILNVVNLGNRRDGDDNHRIVFSRPHLGQTIAFILAIIVAAGATIGSLVLFILRLLGKGATP